jgi:hypothetical protein
VETRGRGVFLKAIPIDVSAMLREQLFERVRAAVLTSATLAVDEGFEYIKSRLGIDSAEELMLASPFDYAEQAVLYVPRGMPDPRSPSFVDRAAGEIAALLAHSRGRAFVLFTSYANMSAVAERLAGEVPYPLLIQGEAPKAVVLATFRSTPGAVLLATTSFWQGVDVVGDQLSCVIIDKLPFASPMDPVVSARIDRLRTAAPILSASTRCRSRSSCSSRGSAGSSARPRTAASWRCSTAASWSGRTASGSSRASLRRGSCTTARRSRASSTDPAGGEEGLLPAPRSGLALSSG